MPSKTLRGTIFGPIHFRGPREARKYSKEVPLGLFGYRLELRRNVSLRSEVGEKTCHCQIRILLVKKSPTERHLRGFSM